MALQDFEDDDPYRTKVLGELDGPIGSGGIAGPLDGGFPTPKPTATYDRDKFVQGWRDSPYGATTEDFQKYAASSPYGAGITMEGADKFRDPTGRIFDVIGNVGTSGAQKRTGYTTDPRYASVTGSKSKATTAKAASSKATPAPAPAANPFLTQIRQLIMSRMGAMSKDPSLDDPTLAAQNQSYARSVDRGAADTRAAMAERAAANGLLQGGQSSGGFDTTLQGIYENAGEDKAAFGANLLGNEVQARRAEVQSLMNMALQSGDAESARALSMQLAQLDAQLRRESMAQQGSQFNAQLGQQQSQWNDNFGRVLGRDYEDDYRYRVNLGLGG